MCMRLFVLIPLLSIICVVDLFAIHGDLDIRIQEVSAAIETHPDSAILYFQRGKLRFQHEEYEASIEDFHTSIAKGYTNELQKIYLAKSWHELLQYDKALLTLNDFLALNSDHVVAIKLKGKLLFDLQQFESAAAHFEKVIQLTIKSLPENYLDAANAWMASNHPRKYENTIDILNLGLKNLGPIITLQDRLILTLMEKGDYEQVINLQKEILAKSARKESAYFKLAEIYLHFDKKHLARDALHHASMHWDKLPLRIRKNTAMQALKNKISLLLHNLQ